MPFERRTDEAPDAGLIRWALIGAKGAVEFLAVDASDAVLRGLPMTRVLGDGRVVMPFALGTHRLDGDHGWDLLMPAGACQLTRGRLCHYTGSALAAAAFLDAWVQRGGTNATAFEMLETHYRREFGQKPR